jgi:hypothetical protein
MIPMDEVMRLRASRAVESAVASDRLHDASSMLGSDDGLSEEELEALHTARPGALPREAKQV